MGQLGLVMANETPLRKSQLTPMDNQRLSRKNELRRIIIDVCKSAINEKVLKEKMHKAGFMHFDLKKKKGRVVGCTYIELKVERTVNFTDLGLHWSDIKKSFADNIGKIDNGDYEYFLHQDLTKAIGREEGAHKDLEEEIKQLEAEQTIASTLDDTPYPSPAGGPGF